MSNERGVREDQLATPKPAPRRGEPDLPSVELPRWTAWVLLSGMALSLLLRWFLLDQFPFMMDELYDTNLGVMVSRGAVLYREIPLERMPLMTFLIAAFHRSSAGSFEAALAARQLMWVGMTLAVLLTWRLGRRFLTGAFALLPPALLLTFSNFLTSSISVRSDLLSTLFSLPALLVLTAPRLGPANLVGSGFALGLAFCTTQKAAYFVVAFAAGLGYRGWCEASAGRRDLRRFLGSMSLVSLGLALPLGCLFAYMAHLGTLKAFVDQTFLYGARAGLLADTYRHSWIHLVETLERNPGIWFLGLCGAAVLSFEGARGRGVDTGRSPRLAALGVWTLVLAALLLQHTAKFPNVFLTIAPGLALCGGVLFERLTIGVWTPERPPDWRHVVWTGAAVALLLVVPWFHHARAFRPELLNYQRMVMDRVDLLTRPDEPVFDGIGIATTRPMAVPWSMTARWFQERRAGARYEIVPYLRLRQPNVVVYNYRLDGMTWKEKEVVFASFVPHWGNVWVAGAPAETVGGDRGSRPIDLLCSAEYSVVAEDLSRVRVDGRPARAVEQLGAGRHVLDVEGEAQRVGLTLAAAVAAPRLPARGPSHMFPSYSE